MILTSQYVDLGFRIHIYAYICIRDAAARVLCGNTGLQPADALCFLFVERR